MDQLLGKPGAALCITAGQWEDMWRQAERLAPEEACGLLAGIETDVLRVYPVSNALHSPVRFRMEPAEQLRVFLEIEQKGWELLGIYHSHPAGPGYPSVTDLQEAYYPEVVFLILFPDAGTWRCRGFYLRESGSREVEIQIGNPPSE